MTVIDNSGRLLISVYTVGTAPADASYVVISLSGDLTAERSLAVGASLSLVDGGANSTVTLNTIQDIRTTASPVFAGLTINGNIRTSGYYVQNETTSLWHRIRLRNNPDGDPELFPDDVGIL